MVNKTKQQWDKLVEVLNDQFPKGDKARGRALILFAEAWWIIQEEYHARTKKKK